MVLKDCNSAQNSVAFGAKDYYIMNNGRVSDKPCRLPRHQRAQAHNVTHIRVLVQLDSPILWIDMYIPSADAMALLWHRQKRELCH
jgi:hypothetical protein